MHDSSSHADDAQFTANPSRDPDFRKSYLDASERLASAAVPVSPKLHISPRILMPAAIKRIGVFSSPVPRRPPAPPCHFLR